MQRTSTVREVEVGGGGGEVVGSSSVQGITEHGQTVLKIFKEMRRKSEGKVEYIMRPLP